MRHIRAMDDLEKAERRQQILSCAADWFDSHSFEQISMQQVAQHCGMAKGTLYLYFSTREEVFLALLEEEFVLWFNALSARLSEIDMADKSERMLAFSHALTSSLAQRPRLLRLIPLLHSVLEQNIPRAAAVRFKRLLMSNLQSIGVEVENRLGFLRPGQGA
ncbi:MAG: TetR/AcrR family transcriptional regulator, partial [Anaerolineae bacterium]|nr:TetR/AcrR family transcriptional regulator [Anaerolineae bacterium]